MIYADYAAGAPLLPQAVNAMAQLAQAGGGNPSAAHSAGRQAAAKLEAARRTLAQGFGAPMQGVVFTSGGTEANNLAIFGLAAQHKGGHIVATGIEHASVLQPLQQLQAQGYRVTLVPPQANGSVSAPAVAAALQADTFLVSIMAVNNESGVVQPVQQIGSLCNAHGIAFHCDAVQAVGHVPLDMPGMGVHLLSLSAHKFGGPMGTGALLVQGKKPQALLYGGRQEMRLRAGTPNLPGIVGMQAALQQTLAQAPAQQKKLAGLRNRLETSLAQTTACRVLGSGAARAAGISLLHFPHVNGEHLMLMLDLQGICISAGAACSSGDTSPSHVALTAGLTPPQAKQVVRVSLGAATTPEEVHQIASAIAAVVAPLQAAHP